MSAPLNRDKLGKVLALLASPVDGEALAAARMVVKMLAAAGIRPEGLAEPLAAPASQNADHAGLDVKLTHQLAENAKQRRQIDALAARIDGLEAELESHRPPLDWLAVVEHFNRPGRRRRHDRDGLAGLELRARTGKLTPADKIELRRAWESMEARKPKVSTQRTSRPKRPSEAAKRAAADWQAPLTTTGRI